jgi:U32 family peptidase
MSATAISTTRRPELLAPAGDREAMRAAVANGADAVYFGLSEFNARHRATNFTVEELPEVMRYLHENGVRGYVTFNTLVFSDELLRAAETLAAIIRAGADAVIVQDLGIARLIKRMAPEFPVHGSTQMTLTEPRGIEFVRTLGVERVILARELSTREIGRIARESLMPLEVFVHGALCVAYSGQCLTSESFGGRSANRGQCAQACRQPYELIVDGAVRDLGDKAYLLSPQDLAAYDLVGDLAALGVCSVKIEGRLKSAHYVAATTQTYRAAIDAAAERQPFDISAQQELDLAQSFSRGFTHGFLDGVNHQQLVHARYPKHRGVRLGTVTHVAARSVTVEIDGKLCGLPNREAIVKPGDGIVFDEGHPEQDEQGGRVFAVRFGGAHTVEITLGRGDVNTAAVSPGAIVWKTDDPAFRRRQERSYSGNGPVRRVTVRLTIRGAPGTRLQIALTDDQGVCAEIESEQPVPEAIKHPLTESLVREQFGRLGETAFVLADIELRNLADGTSAPSLPVMVPKSVLNDLRRRAAAELTARRAALPARCDVRGDALQELRNEAAARRTSRRSATGDRPHDEPSCAVLVRSWEQLQAVLDWSPRDVSLRPSQIYCDFEDVRQFRQAVAACGDAGIRSAPATPRIIKPGEDGLLRQIANCRPDAVLVRNLAAVAWFREFHPELEQVGDYSLNIANELTAELFAARGVSRFVPGYDLNLSQLRAMFERSDPTLFEIVLHQHIPMFHMEHCVFSHVLSNGKDFHDCGRPCDRHKVELKDHVGESHPLVADVGCRNTVFHAQAQSAAVYVPRLRDWGVRHFRVELLRENRRQTWKLIEHYFRVLTGDMAETGAGAQLCVLNQIGLTRGTLEFE